MRRVMLPVMMLALLPMGLLAQTPEERIAAAMGRAASAGIPVELLQSKVNEGKAKGVDMARVATVVERRAAGLARAQAALAMRGSERDAATLDVGADALQSGVSEAVLRAIGETAPRERRAVAIAALTELVNNGNVPEDALLRVQEALARGPDALNNLPAQAIEGRARGAERGQRPSHAGPPAGVPAPGVAPAAGAPSNVPKPPAPPRRRPRS
ncbi:MAG TPA: hypothetical protein VGD27_18130 [Longimicrobiales bacterium]